MADIIGQYQNAVDNKGRVCLPAKMRKSLTPEAAESFTIVPSQEACLFLYPADYWNKFVTALNKVKNTKDNRKVKRKIFGSAEKVELDNQNRISISSSHAAYAGITNEVLFVGNGQYIELWSPVKYLEEDQQIVPDEFEELYENIIDQIQIEPDA